MIDKLSQNEVLHILRNPYGHSEDEIVSARLTAADMIEEDKKWAADILKWCEENGLDTTVHYGGKKS